MALSDLIIRQAKDINPSTVRKQKRQAAGHGFKAAYSLWLDHRRLELREGRQSTLSQIQRIFSKRCVTHSGRAFDL